MASGADADVCVGVGTELPMWGHVCMCVCTHVYTRLYVHTHMPGSDMVPRTCVYTCWNTHMGVLVPVYTCHSAHVCYNMHYNMYMGVLVPVHIWQAVHTRDNMR